MESDRNKPPEKIIIKNACPKEYIDNKIIVEKSDIKEITGMRGLNLYSEFLNAHTLFT